MAIGNFNLAMKDEDEKRLKKLYETSAYVNMAGGMQGYQQMASAQAMMAAGDAMKENPGGGGGGGGNPLLAGAGLGIGMGMAQQFQQGGGGQQQQGRGFTPVGGAPAQAGGGAASVVCPACQKTVAPGKFCAECGGPLAAAGPKFCSGCGSQLNAGAKFCSGCGAQSA
jgi:membrane protease subunit (stomatin/prohibitin family)